MPVSLPQSTDVPEASEPARDVTPEPIAAPRTDASIHALLERLERGVSQRERVAAALEAKPEPEPAPAPAAAEPRRTQSLSDALGELRKMATQR